MKKQIFNPFLPLNEYVPDGEPHVFGDIIYLFGSHDKEAGETFCMLDYVGWSAPVDDLTAWECAGVIYSAKQDPLYHADKMPHMYAPDVVQGNDGLMGAIHVRMVRRVWTPFWPYTYRL